jgi:hypothetical protein
MKPIIIIAIVIVVSVIVLWTIFSQEFPDSDKLQSAIDACTNDIDKWEPSGRNIEICLDDAYNQYGSTKEKQSWFDDEH